MLDSMPTTAMLERRFAPVHILWWVTALIAATVFLAALPLRLRQLQTPLAQLTADTSDHVLSNADLPYLAQLGWSLSQYAWFVLVLEILFAVSFAIAATLIYARAVRVESGVEKKPLTSILSPGRGGRSPLPRERARVRGSATNTQRVALLASLVLLSYAALGTSTTEPLQAQSVIWNFSAEFMQAIGTAGLPILFYVFPDGRFVPRWTKWLAFVWSLAVLAWLLFPTLPLNMLDSTVWRQTPIASGVVSILFYGMIPWLQIYRYWRVSDKEQRQQTRWVVVGFASFISAAWVYYLPSLFIASLNEPGVARLQLNIIGIPIGFALMVLLPLSLVVAILRNQLWQAERVLNRTLVYGTLTVLVVLLYVLIVGGLGTLLQLRGNFGFALLATGLIVVLFQPLHLWVEGTVNRLLFGQRDDPLGVLTQLTDILASAENPTTILPAYAQTIADALKLPFVTINRQDSRAVASAGTPNGQVESIPLYFHQRHVGQLVVSSRAGEGGFGRKDRQLLDQIANQTAAAVQAVRLTDALQRSRERLVTTREEERLRIQRDLHDGLGPMLASQKLKLEAVRVLLERDPESAETMLNEVIQQNGNTVAAVRRLVHALRPPSLDELGLVEMIRSEGEQLAQSWRLIVKVAPDPLPELPAAVQVAAYRIVMEALTNVARHAKATSCIVSLQCDEALRIVVRDNGIGLSAVSGQPSVGVGLSSMRERSAELGGSFQVNRNSDGGTTVTAVLPLGISND